jgi:hypothetical protein
MAPLISDGRLLDGSPHQVTLVDEEPAEVLHLGVEGLRLEAALSSREQSFQLICEPGPLDACVRTQPRMQVLTTALPLLHR